MKKYNGLVFFCVDLLSTTSPLLTGKMALTFWTCWICQTSKITWWEDGWWIYCGWRFPKAWLHCVHRRKATCLTIPKIINHQYQSQWINTYWLMGKVLDQINQWPSILLATCEQCQEICNCWMCQAEIWCSTNHNKLFGTFENSREKSQGDTNWSWERIHKWEIGKLVQGTQYRNLLYCAVFTFTEWYYQMDEPYTGWTLSGNDNHQ